jgi:2-hydroxy-3-keto-5-methylthiopentenyl-1-phosphate phosphatase
MGVLEPDVVRGNYAIWDRVNISASRFAQLLAEHAKPRAGFRSWLDAVSVSGNEIFVVSAGLASYVEPLVVQWSAGKLFEENILSVPCARNGEFAHVRPDLEAVLANPLRTGYAKGAIAQHLRAARPDTEIVVIGDGRSDVHMAKHAHRIYARRYLADSLRQEGRDYHPFESFLDIEPLKQVR